MAFFDPKESYEHIKSRTVQAVTEQFPIRGRNYTLSLEKVDTEKELDPHNIKEQYEAKTNGKTWSVPLYAHVKLHRTDDPTKVIEQKKIRVADLPAMTNRFSYILDGQEYKVDNQWQLKPGAYTRRKQTGELETQFNVVGRSAFDMQFDPKHQLFEMEYKKAHIPAYPILKSLGVTDEQLEKSWGADILQANKKAPSVNTAIQKFYKTATKKDAPDIQTAHNFIKDTFLNSRVTPEVVEQTLGKRIDYVDGDLLLRSTQKLLRVQSGHPEDDRDSLVFKNLRTAGDYVYDSIKQNSRTIKDKITRQLAAGDKKESRLTISQLIKPDVFNRPVREMFLKSSISNVATQINPIEMVSSSQQTTIMGPGGIQSENEIIDEAKMINSSHFGFIDPVHTPEGSKTGISLRLPMGVKRIGDEVKAPLYNLKTGALEMVNAKTFVNSNVVLPDEIKWVNGKPVPVADKVKVAGKGNEFENMSMDKADYVMSHPSQFLNITTNLIPYFGSSNGNRTSMATRHLEQTISLKHREAPLVQVSTGAGGNSSTFEKYMANLTAHVAPADGTVTAIKQDAIHLKGDDGKEHIVHLYNHFPLNDTKGMLHSTPLPSLKVGDKVKKEQFLADTNFTKDGQLAIGTNLRVAYMPFKGLNFEDGTVISETAAEKLTSVHLHKPSASITETSVLNKSRFQRHLGPIYNARQYNALDDDGVVKVGTKIQPGDPLVATMRPVTVRDKYGLAGVRRTIVGEHVDGSLLWDHDHVGEVLSVHRNEKGVTVHVKTEEKMQAGDKIAGRYGNKGIVVAVIPDHEMPKTADGKPLEILLNPTGIPGRMNIGQVYETAMSKIAKKTGKPIVVDNFEPRVDMYKKVTEELKKHGISDTEEVFDPASGKSLGQTLVGYQQINKLVHQVDKKTNVRSGMTLPNVLQGETYDNNLQPTSGKGQGGQSFGSLGVMAMLAHGAVHNLREAQSYKSEGEHKESDPNKKWDSLHRQVWNAIQTGGTFPTPKPTFAFEKFTSYMKAAGINMDKIGNEFVLSPMTDKQVLELSKGRKIHDPTQMVLEKAQPGQNPPPVKGGLFDEKATGGHNGKLWSHIDLAEPIPNPVFERPIQKILELSKTDYLALVHGEKSVNDAGKIIAGNSGITGGAAIKHLLQKVDVNKELKETESKLASAHPSNVNKFVTKAKYLKALQQLKLEPSEAYILHHLPVLPPVMRPVGVMQSGDLNIADMNELYKGFGQINKKLGDKALLNAVGEKAPIVKDLRTKFYDGVRAILGVGVPYEDQQHKGLLHQIAGSSPKTGFFQDRLIERRQDLSARTTIIPEPSLGLDQVGIPKQVAIKLFEPFIIKKLKDLGYGKSALESQNELMKQTPAAWRALDLVMKEQPVLLKRDPVLHKYGIQGFKPVLSTGNAIQIHPLVCGGFNADFDGDSMGLFVPITKEAKDEAHRMMPSNNLFHDGHGDMMYQPTLEYSLGLHRLGLVRNDSGKKFDTADKALAAAKAGELHYQDTFHLGDTKTTLGRVLLAAVVPEAEKKALLTDFNVQLNKKGVSGLLTRIAKRSPTDFSNTIDQLKNLGSGASYGVIPLPTHAFRADITAGHNSEIQKGIPKPDFLVVHTHTLGVKDFAPDYTNRDKHYGAADAEVERIKASNMPEGVKKEKIVKAYQDAELAMKKDHLEVAKQNPTNLFRMQEAGIKPQWEQYKQLVMAPGLLKDSKNNIIMTPIKKSYAEGLNVAEYWSQMYGARRGTIMKVQEVQEPGYMTKLLVNSTMHMTVPEHDCGTQKGILMSVNDKEVFDRHLVKDVKIGNLHIPAGQVITPDLVSQVKSLDKDAKLFVRSPLKCEHAHGVCQKCAGLNSNGQLYSKGTNLGIIASQAVGERAVQLSMKEFHLGGAVKAGAPKIGAFEAFNRLVTLPKPKDSPEVAVLAMQSGTIDKIDHERTGVRIHINGTSHFVGKDFLGQPLHDIPKDSTIDPNSTWAPPKVGMKVTAGQMLSDPTRTIVNPHTLYEATGSIETVQNHLVDEMHKLYKDEGIKRRHMETLVRAMSSVTKVEDPGDHETFLRGEFMPLQKVYKENQELQKAGKKQIQHTPVIKGIVDLPFLVHDDWMAKLQHAHLRNTVQEAAALGGRSNIHGSHPIPAIAYGAEIGLNKENTKFKPIYEHLKKVEEHQY